MGRRILELSPLVLTSVLRALCPGPGRYLTVDDDPLPEDACVVAVRHSPYRELFEIELDSKDWPDVPGRAYVRPTVTVHAAAPGGATQT